MVGVKWYSSQTVPVSTGSAKRCEIWRCKITAFRLVNSGRFSSIAAFNRSIWEEYLTEFTVWLYGRKYTMSFQSHKMHSATSFGDQHLECLTVTSFRFPRTFFVPNYDKTHFSSTVIVLFKNGSVLLSLVRVSQTVMQFIKQRLYEICSGFFKIFQPEQMKNSMREGYREK